MASVEETREQASADRPQEAERGRVTAGGLLYSETEQDLAAALADLLASQAAAADVIARTEQAETFDAKLWRTVAAEIGIAGLLIPEALGGAGASYRELAAAAEQFGASVAPIPYLGSAAVGDRGPAVRARPQRGRRRRTEGRGGEGRRRHQPAAVRAGGRRPRRRAARPGPGRRWPARRRSRPAAGLLRQLAGGSITAALAVSVTTAPGAPFPAAARVAGRATASGHGQAARHDPRGAPTRCPPTCCSCRRTACPARCTWSRRPRRGCTARRWSRST